MKPCTECGEALPNNAKQCEKCGAEQSDVLVKETSKTEPLPPGSGEHKRGSFLSGIFFWLPFALGAIGGCFFGLPGLVAGITIGFLCQIVGAFWSLWTHE